MGHLAAFSSPSGGGDFLRLQTALKAFQQRDRARFHRDRHGRYPGFARAWQPENQVRLDTINYSYIIPKHYF